MSIHAPDISSESEHILGADGEFHITDEPVDQAVIQIFHGPLADVELLAPIRAHQRQVLRGRGGVGHADLVARGGKLERVQPQRPDRRACSPGLQGHRGRVHEGAAAAACCRPPPCRDSPWGRNS